MNMYMYNYMYIFINAYKYCQPDLKAFLQCTLVPKHVQQGVEFFTSSSNKLSLSTCLATFKHCPTTENSHSRKKRTLHLSVQSLVFID